MMDHLKQNAPLISETASTESTYFLKCWDSFRNEVKGKCSSTAFANWIEPCKAVESDNKKIIEEHYEKLKTEGSFF